MTLSPPCARVLGSLVEKALTTPQQYPLTLNALVAACNQASNREPVVSYDEATVDEALHQLKDERLVRFVLPSHGRSVVRYRHVLDETWDSTPPRAPSWPCSCCGAPRPWASCAPGPSGWRPSMGCTASSTNSSCSLTVRSRWPRAWRAGRVRRKSAGPAPCSRPAVEDLSLLRSWDGEDDRPPKRHPVARPPGRRSARRDRRAPIRGRRAAHRAR